jgi:hypothetical protein
MTVRNANAIEAVVGWMDAMRRGDLAAVAEWFDPKVSWRGVPEEALCRNREDVLEMLGESLVPCPEDPKRLELEPGLRGAEAVELITADSDTVILGAKVPGLSEIGGQDLGGQLRLAEEPLGARGLARHQDLEETATVHCDIERIACLREIALGVHLLRRDNAHGH